VSDTSASLGPLTLHDGRWVVGDVRRPDGWWVEFREDGLFQHARNSKGELIPWSRFMLGMRVTVGAKYPSRSFSMMGIFGGVPGPWKGHGGGYLHMTLRHPYEDWVVRFDRHPRWYSGFDVLGLEELLRQTIDAGEADRLGDPDWLGPVVERLAPQRPWTVRAIREAVTRAREAEAAA